MKYDAQYFVDKFSPIPDEQWTTGTYEDENGCKCALGHCGDGSDTETFEGSALMNIARAMLRDIVMINDRHDEDYLQLTPKARILAFLEDAKQTGY